MSAIPRSAIVEGDPNWLLDLTIGGKVYHVAVFGEDYTNEAGDTVTYAPGLAALEVVIGREAQSVSLSVQGLEDWALLVGRGLDLSAGTATLRRSYTGQTLESTRVFATGRLLEPTYGGVYEPLEFTIESRQAAQPFPDPDYVIDSRTWPVTTSPFELHRDTNVQGAVYPTVFGRPGYGSGPVLWGTVQLSIAGSPAYLAEFGGGSHTFRSSKLVIAGHTVAATTVRVIDVSGGYGRPRPDADQKISETLPVAYTEDLLGNRVAYADFTTAKMVRPRPGNEYWIEWNGDGGLLRPGSTSLIRGAGEVIAYLLDRSGLKVARGKVQAARAKLDRYLLDTAIVESVDVDQWIMDNIGSLIPLCRRENGNGVWYELIPYDATIRDVEMHLVAEQYDGYPVGARSAGAPVAREGAVQYTPLDRVCNEITLESAPDRGEKFTRRIVFTGRDATPSDTEIPVGILRSSRIKYGERKKAVKAYAVHDEPTAKLIGQMHALWYGLPRRVIRYNGGLELDALNVNSVVTITDTELHITEALAVVQQISLTLSGVSLTLELLDTPANRQRATT